MNKEDKFSEKYPEQNKFLEYEVFGSWWTGYIFAGWMQTLAGKYFAWKMLKKYNRYKNALKNHDNHLLPHSNRPS